MRQLPPVQLTPLAKLLEEANLSPTELSSLLSTLAAAVESFPVDDISFYSGGDYPAVKAKAQLLQLAGKKQVSPGAFMHSFHEYLDRSLNGPGRQIDASATSARFLYFADVFCCRVEARPALILKREVLAVQDPARTRWNIHPSRFPISRSKLPEIRRFQFSKQA